MRSNNEFVSDILHKTKKNSKLEQCRVSEILNFEHLEWLALQDVGTFKSSY